MDSRYSEKLVREEAVRIESRDGSIRVLRANFAEEPELAIDEGFDLGGDPYNSTGRHVIIKPRINLED